MHAAIDAQEVATALLFEARAFAAQHRAHAWPARSHPPSSNDALVRAWEAHPLQNVVAREGFAIARRALKGVTAPAPSKRVDVSATLRELDAALAELMG